MEHAINHVFAVFFLTYGTQNKNSRYFVDYIQQTIFVKEIFCILIKIAIQLLMGELWFKQWYGGKQAANYYLNQW